MDALRGEDMGADHLDHWHQRRRRRADPVGKGRHVEIDAFPRIDRALTVKRQMQAILGEQDMGEQLRPRPRAIGAMGRAWDRFAGPAGELLADMLDHFPLPRNELQGLGHVLADLAQCRAAAAWAGRGCRIDDALARQMLGQRTARRPAPFERCHRNLLVVATPPSAPPPQLAQHPPPNRRVEARADRAAHHAPRIGRTARAEASGSNLSFSINSARYCASLSAAVARSSAALSAWRCAMMSACALARSVGSESSAHCQ